MPKYTIQVVTAEPTVFVPGEALYDYLGQEIAVVWEVY